MIHQYFPFLGFVPPIIFFIFFFMGLGIMSSPIMPPALGSLPFLPFFFTDSTSVQILSAKLTPHVSVTPGKLIQPTSERFSLLLIQINSVVEIQDVDNLMEQHRFLPLFVAPPIDPDLLKLHFDSANHISPEMPRLLSNDPILSAQDTQPFWKHAASFSLSYL